MITYPAPPGAPPFVVAQDYDPYGHVLAVRDAATNLPYWRLTDVDSAGRFRKEVFGKDVSTERAYYPDKQRLAGIITQCATPVAATSARSLRGLGGRWGSPGDAALDRDDKAAHGNIAARQPEQ